MYKKKIVFSFATVPVIVFVQQLAEYQQRAKDEKNHENERRAKALLDAP